MPIKDKKQRSRRSLEYTKETYAMISMKIRKDSEEWDALEECKAHTGIPYATYAHTALIDKLKKDGYITENQEE